MYYKRLDIIRNISCLGVLFYHLGLLKGGYLAVCIFFVLSGYLACNSMFKKKKVSFKEYYKNRLLHIYVPLLFTVLLSIVVISIFPEINWLNLKPESTSVLTGTNNFWQLSVNFDYFARHTDSPFIHFWYIAILLQFELVFPFLFLGLKKLGEKKKSIPCIILGLLSIISCAYFVYMALIKDASFVYYHTLTRVFSILFGMFCAFYKHDYQRDIPKFLLKKNIPTIIFYSYLVISVVSFFMASSESKYYFIPMIIISIITCRLLAYGTINDDNKLNSFDKFMKSFASISYEVYLVQYPIIFIIQSLFDLDILWSTLLIVCSTFIVAFILHYSTPKKNMKLLPNICSGLITIICLYGLYLFIITPDHTEEMKALENELSANQEMIKKRQEEYLSRAKEEESNWNSVLAEMENKGNNLEEIVHNISIVGVGDSVMLGATNSLYNTFPNGYFDAKVSRTDYEANGILQSVKSQGRLGEVVVLALGTNGQCGARCRNVIYQTIQDKKIFWVNVTNDWSVHVNSGLEAFANEHDNVYLVDWKNASLGHANYFVADGIHLTKAGTEAYAKTLYDAIYNVYYEEYQKMKENMLKEHDEKRNNKITFYGNDTLLNLSNDLQNSLSDFEIEIFADREKSIAEIISNFKEASSSSTFSKNVIFLIDSQTEFTKDNYLQIKELTKELNVSIIFMNDVNYSDSDNLHIYSFKDYLKKHPNYYSVDRVHLSPEGNLALANFIQEKIKATK